MPKKSKHLNTKTQFKEALAYLKESSSYIYSAIFLFAISIVFGIVFKENLSFIDKILREIVDKTAGLSAPELIFFILQNNLETALLSLLLGIFFGIFPIFNALANGVIIGYVLALSYKVAGLSSWWRILPHGIFELPAIFIALGLGMKLGFTIFLKKQNKIKEFKRRFYNSFNVFLMIVIPLLIIAAIIEGLLIAFVG